MSSSYQDMTIEQLEQKRQEIYEMAKRDALRGYILGAQEMRAEAQRIEEEIARRQRGDA